MFLIQLILSRSLCTMFGLSRFSFIQFIFTLQGPSFDTYLWALAIHLVSNALISGNMSDHFGHSFSHVVPTPRVLPQVLHHNAKD